MAMSAFVKVATSMVTNTDSRKALKNILIAVIIVFSLIFVIIGGFIATFIGLLTGTNDYSNNADFTGDTNAEIAWNYFISQGCNEYATAGILGNLKQESGLDPTIEQGGGGPGRGIAQWTYGGSRWDGLMVMATEQGTEWTSLETQLAYIWYEFSGAEKRCYQILTRDYGGIDTFKNAESIEWATKAFERSYERAGKPNMSARIQYAYEFYSYYSGGDDDE